MGEISGLPFDLPTEAQWEYAARSGGKNIVFATDNGKYERGRNIANRNLRKNNLWFYPVGVHPPNPMGFYDMAGNACEWVDDWYDSQYYKKSPEKNPKGPEVSPYKEKPWKICRGGYNMGSFASGFTVFARFNTLPDRHRNGSSGMRCAMQLKVKLSRQQLIERALKNRKEN